MSLLCHYKVNVTFYDDLSHGCNCDLKVALKSAGLFQFWLLMLTSWNLPWGVDSDEERRLQLRECMKAVFCNESPYTCVLYKA
jgi:hypothetical protein